MIRAPTVATDAFIQITELLVLTSSGVNVALGKNCSASSTYSSTNACNFAVDGVTTLGTSFFHSGSGSKGDWFKIDLGGNFPISKIVYYNRNSNTNRASGSLLQLLDSDGRVFAQRTLTNNLMQTFIFSTTSEFIPSVKISCENEFEGGNWALVRRVRQSSTWHPATDALTGKDVYGTYGLGNADSTFSIDYSSWVNSSTEFLFITGSNSKV
jgi:hypothetical protein